MVAFILPGYKDEHYYQTRIKGRPRKNKRDQ